MIVLTSLGGRRLTLRPRFVAGVKEMEPDPEFGPVCRVHLSQRSIYVVRGSFDEITQLLGLPEGVQAPGDRAAPRSETGWVIEHGDPSAPEYWDGIAFTRDHLGALRLARESDAENLRNLILMEFSPQRAPLRIALHAWYR